MRVHINVTHPDGEYDITDAEVPDTATPAEAQALATDEVRGMLIDGDVVALNFEGEFFPFAEFTHEVPA